MMITSMDVDGLGRKGLSYWLIYRIMTKLTMTHDHDID